MSDGTDRTEHTIACVRRGLMHELANIVTVIAGLAQALELDGPAAVDSTSRDLTSTAARLIEVHRDLRSLIPDAARDQACDPRPPAAEAARLLSWHSERRCVVTLDDGPAAPVFGAPWRIRRHLLGALDQAAGTSGTLRFSLRLEGEELVAVTAGAGTVIWSAPLLAAARRDARRDG